MHSVWGMVASSLRAQAVFHDRATMEEAVRALELEGIRRRHIHVQRAAELGGELRTPPERSSAALVGAGVGAALGLGLALLSLAAGAAVMPAPDAALRIAGLVVAGALLGGLVGIVTSRLRHQSRYGDAASYRDFVVRVDASDEVTAENIRDLLARAGGDPLPA